MSDSLVLLPSCADAKAPPPICLHGGDLDADQDLASSYLGARYYASQTGRFTTVDPEHINGNIYDPQSWNGYVYARNNPLKYTDPDGHEYEICAEGSPSCQRVSDQYFSYLQMRPGAGIQLFGGFIYAGAKGVGTYRQTSVDATIASMLGDAGSTADAGVRYSASVVASNFLGAGASGGVLKR